MGKVLNVLYGFKHRTTENAVTNCLESYGYKVQSKTRYSKATIKDFLSKTEDIDVVFLKEFLEGGEKYSALEISELSDKSKANFIVVVRPQHKGHDSMKTLYAAGILNAVFADQRMGVKPDILANLALKGRTHFEARTYYKIDSPLPDYGLLSYEDFRDNYAYFCHDIPSGAKKIDRFIDITRSLSPVQLSKFIENLQPEDIAYLSEFHDYYDVLEELYAQGAYSEKVKRPKGDLKRAVEKKDAEKVFSGQAFIIQPDILPILEPVHIDMGAQNGVGEDYPPVAMQEGVLPQGGAPSQKRTRRKRISPEERQAMMNGSQRGDIEIHGVPNMVSVNSPNMPQASMPQTNMPQANMPQANVPQTYAGQQGGTMQYEDYGEDVQAYMPQEQYDAGYDEAQENGYVDDGDSSYGQGYVQDDGYEQGYEQSYDDRGADNGFDQNGEFYDGQYDGNDVAEDQDYIPNDEDEGYDESENGGFDGEVEGNYNDNTSYSGEDSISSQNIEGNNQDDENGGAQNPSNAVNTTPRRKRRSEMSIEELAQKYQ